MPKLQQEMWLAHRVGKAADMNDSLSMVFDGVTTPEQRGERVRFAIVSHGLGEKPCGRRAGQSTTFGEMYQRIYGAGL